MDRDGPPRRTVNVWLAVGASLLMLAASELALRASDRGWSLDVDRNEPTLHEPHAVLGWRGKPGRYRIPPYVPGGAPILETLWEDGGRATGARPPSGPADVVAIGGSVTQGWGVSDEETYVWRLARRHPDAVFLNYGTAGYGTYQSVLALEGYLARAAEPPRVALYGMIDHHELRNVGDPLWLASLARLGRRGHVALPSCVLDPVQELACGPPRAYPLAWLDRASALVFNVRLAYYTISRGPLVDQAPEVTRRLLLRMHRSAEARGTRLLVALLDMGLGARAAYGRFLRDHEIAVRDCVDPDLRRPEMVVPGEGHPNGRMHRRFADCIEPALAGLLVR